MDQYSFKSVTFGGFDKQDVVNYLEQASEKAAAAQSALEHENEDLRRQLEELTAKNQELQDRADHLERQLKAESEARENLESMRFVQTEVLQWKAKAESLRPDAEAYARFRERLGSIECEARDRADRLEEAAAAQTRRMAEQFQGQYQRLMSTFQVAAGRVTDELQALQAALDRLPRSLEPTEAEMNALLTTLNIDVSAPPSSAKEPELPEEGTLSEEEKAQLSEGTEKAPFPF